MTTATINTDGISGKQSQGEQPKVVDMSKDFALLSRLILRDLNSYDRRPPVFFTKINKHDVAKWLEKPYRHEKQLRDAIRYIYHASSHFRRLIQYFVGLSDLAYIVEPYRIDPKKANDRIVNINYRKVLNLLSIMSIKTQFPKMLKVCLREDVFYGTIWHRSDSITIQQLPSEYCAISSQEGNVFNASFDFSYFNLHEERLDFYPEEFRKKYKQYCKDKKKYRWIELDSPTSFAIKCNDDFPDHAIPPFAGILREVFDLEDYKNLDLDRTALENYAMLAMKIPLNDDGEWGIDLDKAKEFWSNLDKVLPDLIGSVLTPMDIEKISFERSSSSDRDTITEAEQSLFTAAGVSSLLFNNAKASANALLLSIKADQTITYGIVKSIQDMVNRFIQAQSYGKYFKVNFLDVSPFNRKEVGDAYLKAASYGFPTISAYMASQGVGQAELDSMSYLEGEVLELQKMFKPVVSSSQLSPSNLISKAPTDEGGAPEKDMDELTESGEQNREDA